MVLTTQVLLADVEVSSGEFAKLQAAIVKNIRISQKNEENTLQNAKLILENKEKIKENFNVSTQQNEKLSLELTQIKNEISTLQTSKIILEKFSDITSEKISSLDKRLGQFEQARLEVIDQKNKADTFINTVEDNNASIESMKKQMESMSIELDALRNSIPNQKNIRPIELSKNFSTIEIYLSGRIAEVEEVK